MRKGSQLVKNDASKTFTGLTLHSVPTGCRIDNLEGREYTVVPMVILTEGVHEGSQGPLLYPKDELSKTPVVWNHKPIVIYHPDQGASACEPAFINTRKVGLMMNTRYEKGRLRSEAWLEKDRANAIDERIMKAVENKEMMELSTGLFIDVEREDGNWKGEEYTGVARNFRPDHLALLPDKIGACSIADGAGLLRNQVAANPPLKDLLNQLGLELRAEIDSDPISVIRLQVQDNETTNNNMKKKLIAILVANAVTTLGNVTLSAEMTDEQIKVVNDDHLEKAIKDLLEKKAKEAAATNTAVPLVPAKTETTTPAAAAPAKTETTPAAPAVPKVVTLQEYVSAAPKEVQEVLNNSMMVYNDEKKKLIDIIIANKKNIFTKADLENRPLGELKALAQLAAPEPVENRVPLYGGQAPIVTDNNQDDEPLMIPTLNFDPKKEKETVAA